MSWVERRSAAVAPAVPRIAELELERGAGWR